MKLGSKLILIFSICLAVIVTTFIFWWISYTKFQNIESNESKFNENLDKTAFYFEDYINIIEDDINEVITNELILHNESYTKYITSYDEGLVYAPSENEIAVIEVLHKFLGTNETEFAYIALEDGSFVSSSPIMGEGAIENSLIRIYDPRDDDWYKDAKDETNSFVISDAYSTPRFNSKVKSSTDSYYVTMSKAILNENNEVIGVMGFDINISNFINRLVLSFRKDIDEVTLHMGESYLVISDKYQKKYKVFTENSNTDELLVFQDNNTLIIKHDFKIENWSLSYSINEDTLEKDLNNNSDIALIIIFFIMIMLILLVMLILTNKTIIEPLQEINDVTNHILKTGDLSRKISYEGKSELASIGQNFNKMIDEIKNKNDNLENIVFSRTEELSKFKAAIEQSFTSVIITDINGNIQYVNPRFSQVTGYKSEEVLGLNPRVFSAKEHNDIYNKNLWPTVIKGESWQGILSNKTKSGDIILENTIVSPIKNRDGEITNFIALKEDITQKDEKEKNLEMLFENMTSGFAEYEVIYNENGKGIDYKYRNINSAFTKITGMTKDVIGKTIREVYPNIDNKKIEKYWEVAKTGKPVVFEEYSSKLKRYHRISAFSTKANNFVILMDDITKRKESEEIQKSLNEKLITLSTISEYEIVDKISYFNYILSELLILTKSKEGFIYHYYEKDEFIAKSEAVKFEDYEQRLYYSKNALLLNNKKDIKKYYQGNNEEYQNLVVIPVYYENEKVGCIGVANKEINYTEIDKNNLIIIMDTVWKKYELYKNNNELVKSKLFSEEVINSSPVPFGIFDIANCKVLSCNKALLNFMKLKKFESYIPEELYVDIVQRKEVLGVYKRDGRLNKIEVILRRLGTMEEVPTLLSINPLIFLDKQYSIVSFIDITAINESRLQMKEAKYQAEEAARIKSEFLANMSHEIRTPMNAIIGLNNLIKNTKLNTQQTEYIDKIDTSSKHLLNIINNILDFSKAESGQIELENLDFSIDDMLDDTINLVKVDASKKDLEIIILKEKDVPEYVIGDSFRIGQVMLNLLSNAIKFTDVGQIVIKVELLDLLNEKVNLLFSVADSGIGIDDNQKDKLFNAFSQADSSTTRKYGGTGLGLVISKKIVEMMSGKIWVESTIDEGSEFKFTVSTKASNNINEEFSDMSELNILLVDSNEISKKAFENNINKLGCKCESVSTEYDALHKILNNEYDLIIVDSRVGNHEGIDFIKTAKEQLKEKVLPKTILATPCLKNEIYQRAMNENFEEVIEKPITLYNLYNTILDIVSNDRVTHCAKKYIEAIKGYRILVVDDDEINTQVLTGLLVKNGLIVDAASNGLLGIEKVLENNYDFILMDIQMPVMGGLKATELLRNEYKNNTPIIGLSALDLDISKIKAKKAGMDDCLLKPINKNKLCKTLMKWVKEKDDIQQFNDLAIDSAISYNDVIDILNDFDVEDGFNRASNDLKLYTNILEKYSTNYKGFFMELYSILQKGDVKTAKSMVHAFKGTTGIVGAKYVMNEILIIEKALFQGRTNDVIKQIDYSSKTLNSANEQIGKLIKIKNSIEKAKIDNLIGINENDLIVKLKSLHNMIEEYNIKATDLCEELNTFKLDKKRRNKLKQISKKLKDYSFDDALVLCKNMIEKI